MTEKQEKILHSALELFAKEGYRATSTSKVAKKAGVSEGLIFRHFENKDGLLQAIMCQAEGRVKDLFSEIIFETEPKKTINKLFDLMLTAFNKHEDMEYWKLMYKLKWETEQYGEHKMEPLMLALTNAFKKLGYQNPELEAQLLAAFMDGLITKSLLSKDCQLEKLVNFLKTKYKL